MLRTLASLLQHARARLARGGVLAYPTESCFGLGCHPASATGQPAPHSGAQASADAQRHDCGGANWAQLAPYGRSTVNSRRVGRLLARPGDFIAAGFPAGVAAIARPSPQTGGAHHRPSRDGAAVSLAGQRAGVHLGQSGRTARAENRSRLSANVLAHAVSVLPGHWQAPQTFNHH